MPFKDPEKKKAYQKAYSKEWSQTPQGKESRRNSSARYRAIPENREKEKQRAKDHYYKNREKEAQRNKEYRRTPAGRESDRKSSAKRYMRIKDIPEFREKERLRGAEYRETHPEERKEYRSQRRKKFGYTKDLKQAHQEKYPGDGIDLNELGKNLLANAIYNGRFYFFQFSFSGNFIKGDMTTRRKEIIKQLLEAGEEVVLVLGNALKLKEITGEELRELIYEAA